MRRLAIADHHRGDWRLDHVAAHAAEIKQLVAASPDITLKEIAARLKQTQGETFVASTIWRCLDRHGSTFK